MAHWLCRDGRQAEIEAQLRDPFNDYYLDPDDSDAPEAHERSQ